MKVRASGNCWKNTQPERVAQTICSYTSVAMNDADDQ